MTSSAPTLRIRALDLILTSDCNLRCAYCYQDAKHPGRMRPDTLRGALDLVRAFAAGEVRVHFVGGEPLLAFDLLERAVTDLEASKPATPKVSYSVSTNGLLLGRRERRFLDDHRVHVRLSFDGVREMQDLRGERTFSRLDRLLGVLAAEHPSLFAERLSVLVTVVPETVGHLSETVCYLLQRGARDISIEPAMTRAVTWTHERHRALAAQFAAILQTSLAHYRGTGLIPLRRFRPRTVGGGAPGAGDWFCGVGTGRSLTVDVDGSVTGCVMFARSYQRFPDTRLGAALASLGLGRIGQRDLPDRVASYGRAVEATGLFNNRLRKWSSWGRCSACRFRAGCVLCPCAIAHAGTDDDPDRIPDFICAFNRVACRYQARFPATSAEPDWRRDYERVLTLAQRAIARETAVRGLPVGP